MSCPNCGSSEPHFVPPSLGEPGFYICESAEPVSTCWADVQTVTPIADLQEVIILRRPADVNNQYAGYCEQAKVRSHDDEALMTPIVHFRKMQRLSRPVDPRVVAAAVQAVSTSYVPVAK